MTEWVSCPKCGALMIGLTGSHICPLCGYRLPVQTITYTTGTSAEYIQVIRCRDCKFHHDRTQCKKRIGAWFDDDYCNGAVRAERKEHETD